MTEEHGSVILSSSWNFTNSTLEGSLQDFYTSVQNCKRDLPRPRSSHLQLFDWRFNLKKAVYLYILREMFYGSYLSAMFSYLRLVMFTVFQRKEAVQVLLNDVRLTLPVFCEVFDRSATLRSKRCYIYSYGGGLNLCGNGREVLANLKNIWLFYRTHHGYCIWHVNHISIEHTTMDFRRILLAFRRCLSNFVWIDLLWLRF